MKIGDTVAIQSYKHDSTIHRIWEKSKILLIDDEKIIVSNRRTKVIEDNGRFWYTKEPSVTIFYTKAWYNIIGIIKGNDVSFYCNISSPALMDEEAIKYIDYDLDIKVAANGEFYLLDQNEYKKNCSLMGYPDELRMIIDDQTNELAKKIEQKEDPFNKQYILDWYYKVK